jgi:hypothetical protein
MKLHRLIGHARPGDFDSLFFSGPPRQLRLGAGLRRLFHGGFAERVERHFKLAHQDVRTVGEFLGVLPDS